MKNDQIKEFVRNIVERRWPQLDKDRTRRVVDASMELVDKLPGCHIALDDCHACRYQIADAMDNIFEVMDVIHGSEATKR